MYKRQVISQCISAALVTYSLMHAYDVMKLKLREIRMNMSVLAKELKIGIPGALQACAYGVTNVIIQAVVNGFGTDTAAGWAAYGKLDMIFWTVNSALGVDVYKRQTSQDAPDTPHMEEMLMICPDFLDTIFGMASRQQ